MTAAHPSPTADSNDARPWAGAEAPVSQIVLRQSEMCLRSYEANPTLVEEHANIERSTTQGGYGRRQLYELVQNGADELQNEPGGGIQVVLTRDALYCANLGTPVSPEGAQTILASHLSRKRGTEIGRFGLGFKSVLSISDRPQFFSRTGSFGWDSAQARHSIMSRIEYNGPTPVLRIAHLLDPAAERHRDSVLDELMTWATTVVKLPLTGDHATRLSRDLKVFPSRFAIFSPHVGEVILEDRRDPRNVLRREIYVRGEGNRRTLFTDEGSGTSTSEWVVFETIHAPTAKARQDAGEYHDRTQIPLAWAVPTSGQQGPGQFWAFFPTTYETTLRGVLNAPWKTNEDRQNLLQHNTFNEELMKAAAELIVQSLPELSTPEDPARHLTLITARGREARNWADSMLTDLVYGLAAKNPSLPDQTGRLRKPAEIKLHPERIEKKWLALWAAYPGRPTDWCHESIEETVRRSRAEIVLERAGKKPSTVRLWLEALVSDRSPAASAVALSIVADMVHRESPHAEQARQARILRTDTGEMVAPVADTVFRRTPMDLSTDELIFVDPVLEENSTTSWALEVLGIREADALGRFAAIVKQGFRDYKDPDWERFWHLARQAGAERAVEHLHEHGVDPRQLKVRVRANRFLSSSNCLLPGRVIPEGSNSDHDLVVDIAFHHADIGMLRALGMSDGPRVSVDPSQEIWFTAYREQVIDIYYKRLPANVGRPNEQSIVLEGTNPSGPLGLLPRLSKEACARFLTALPSVGLITQWHVRAKTRRNDAPIGVTSPLIWMVKRHGTLPTSRGLLPVRHCLGLGLEAHAHILPVAKIDPALSAALKLPERLEQIPGNLWSVLFESIATSENAADVGAFYGLAEIVLSAPDEVRCRRRDSWTMSPTSDVAVTADEAQYRRLLFHDVPTILVPDSQTCARLVEEWGMKSFDEALVTELRVTPLGEPTPLEDVFPYLRLVAGRPAQRLALVRCKELDELIRTPSGQISQPLDIGRQDDTVYWREREDDLELIRRLSALLNLGFTEERCQQVLRQQEEARRSKRVVQVRTEKSAADKLLAMLPAKTIKEKIPQIVIDAVEAKEGRIDDRTTAELAISVHGTAVLREYRSELEKNGFTLPTQMAGGHEARKFTEDLGFPAEFAGFRRPSLEPVITVEGPVDFPPLHNYQERMVQRMCEVLQSRGPQQQRGMLSLPTGAGKTRVAVEAVTRTLRTLPKDRASQPVLWIAQSEELCEQAVQTWHFVWKNIGPTERLTISRLWSGNEADPVTEGFHLVVATDAKLENVVETEEYEWLRKAQSVIIDEAHTSISPRYTRVLDALGLTPHRTRCPLIGLSATPFRGVSAEGTERLARRYMKNRLDRDRDDSDILGENPYLTLQKLGVLARVQHRVLQGATLELTVDEQENLQQLRRLPASAEERLGSDQERNNMLLDEICDLPEDWQILLFATSVSHAQAMAALLVRRGVKAAAVSGSTDDGVRRHTIEQFRQRKIRVLTNYGVLSQGFDAPATRAVVVARPTYSPNVYQQMIGRGLRGPRNGGKEECLIVNVADNIAQYGEELAFRQFEYLWNGE
ncbi:DEAD/DEAH box helicase [Streptosporangium canum]|uniref:DEAD/DEAH box helicase n=1 Tax=Streptosporangium canum TaxID=324952 RepID=UPI0033B6D896